MIERLLEKKLVKTFYSKGFQFGTSNRGDLWLVIALEMLVIKNLG